MFRELGPCEHLFVHALMTVGVVAFLNYLGPLIGCRDLGWYFLAMYAVMSLWKMFRQFDERGY